MKPSLSVRCSWCADRSRGRRPPVSHRGTDAARLFQEESLALSRESGHKRYLADALFGLGQVALARAEMPAARQLMAESLGLCREMGKKRGIATCLAGLAGLASAEGEFVRAVQLIGAAQALLAATKSRLELDVRPTYDLAVASARTALGEEAFATARADGEQMTLEEAVAYALKVVTP